jgi:apolipoprotein N-acyltransferase
LLPGESWRPGWACTGLAALAGALTALGFPPYNQLLISFAGFILFCYVGRRLSPKKAWSAGLVFGFVLSLFKLHWIMESMVTYGQLLWIIAIIPLIIFSFYLAQFTALWAAGMSAARKSRISPIWAAPLAWVLSEWIQSILITGFPWVPLGHIWVPCLPLVQSAEIWGVYGVSGLVVLVGMLLARMIPLKVKPPGKVEILAGLAGMALVAGAYYWGLGSMAQVNQAAKAAPKLTTSVVQGNVAIPDMWVENKRLPIIKRHVQLSQKEAAKVAQRPWLLVWSESAAPFFFVSDQTPSQPVFEWCAGQKAMVLLGTLGSVRLPNGKIGMTNRTWLVDALGRYAGYYDKVHLVPFGEYVPWDYIFFWVRALAVMSDNFSPGVLGSTITAGPATLGPLICYESIFPELAREQRQRGADLIINQTNDAWFGDTGASWQHLSHLVMRSIENRMACARSANAGVSCFVHPDGRVSNTTGLFTTDVRTEELPLLKMDTLYTRYGHLVGPLSLAGVLVIFLAGGLLSRRTGRSGS